VSIEVDMVDETERVEPKHWELVQNILQFACEEEGVVDGSEVSVSFVDNEMIQAVNREYREIDRPTDVISFALNDDEIQPQAEGIPNLLGDIIISVPKAREQAEEYGHSFERELGFLAVHGLLHLLGYDHMNKEEEQTMFSRQERILEAYGLPR
jgi:probable rRNA maturation factor